MIATFKWQQLQLFPLLKHCTLLKVGVGPVGLDHAASLLGNPAWQRELDLAVMHLGDQRSPALSCWHHLAPNDLDCVSPGPVPGAHVAVALRDGGAHGKVPVLSSMPFDRRQAQHIHFSMSACHCTHAQGTC